MLRFIKEYFLFTRSETRISLVILCLLIASLVFRLIVANKSYLNPHVNDEILSEVLLVINNMDFQTEEKAILKPKFENDGKNILPEILKPAFFNPNKVDSTELIAMGLKKNIVWNILKYRKAGGRFNVKTDLLKIYGMDDSVFALLSTYIVLENDPLTLIPDLNDEEQEIVITGNLININTADSASLISIKGIGPTLAGRIVKFRNILGGFYSSEQLMQVYGMDSSRYFSVMSTLYIDKLEIRKINVNEVEEWQLSRHPYISVNLARDIMKYKEISGKIKVTDELVSAGILTSPDFQKISYYLKCE